MKLQENIESISLKPMRVAINLAGLHKEQADYIEAVFSLLAAQQVHHSFFFIEGKKKRTEKMVASHAAYATITTKPRSVLLLKWWYGKVEQIAAKKLKADLLVCADGLCGTGNLLPKLLIFDDETYQKLTPKFYRRHKLFFYKKYLKKCVENARFVATKTVYHKNVLAENFKIDAAKIGVVGGGKIYGFNPEEWEEKERIKEKFAGGKEYFLLTTAAFTIPQLIEVLKAFSIFKKRQHSNMMLLINWQTNLDKAAFKKKLETYTFKNYVVVLDMQGNYILAQLTAAAYCCIFFSNYENYAKPILQAFQCHVPIIATQNNCCKELGADAATYANHHAAEAIAEQLKFIFKNEQQRNELIEKGKMQMQNFDWQQTANRLWKMMQTIKKNVAN